MNYKNNKIELKSESIIPGRSLSNGVRNVIIAHYVRK
jgi:hypothetical protein